jgi:hypothetical protein
MPFQIPQPRIPHVTLPTIGNIPTLPLGIGCAGADATHYIGGQFGNLPNFQKLLHLKTLRKTQTEQIYALIQGELPDSLRPTPYAARAAQLTTEVATIATAITSVVNDVTGEINAAITYVNQQVAAVNTAKNAIAAVPDNARSAVQKLMFERYGRYATELNAQASRLEATLTCVTS